MKKSKIEIFYSEECLKHIFVPEPTDYPYMRDQIKSNIPENSSRLDVLVSKTHGLLKLNSFVNFKLKKIKREANISDILKVHDISYIKNLINKMRKYKMDSVLSKEFMAETKTTSKNYIVTEKENKEAADCIEQMVNLANLENNINVYHSVKTEKDKALNEKEKQTVEDAKKLLEKNNEAIENQQQIEKITKINNEIKKKKETENVETGKERIEKLLVLDSDTFINKYSFNCATHASGVVLSAIDYVYLKKEKAKKKSEKRKNIFCAIRPPGHHLGTYGAAQFNLTDEDVASGSQGFCILNNIAIGAAYAKYKYDTFERIAIVDFDIHHGNGTEQIIRNLGVKKIKVNEHIDIYYWKGWKNENDKKNIFFSSIHAFDGYFYPGTGNDTVELQPYIINVTLKKNMKSKDFLTLFKNNILIHLFYFKPDILFLSSGFDGHELDYVNNGFVKKTTSTYFYLTRLILSLQNKVPFPIVSVLEGGYNTFNDMSSVFSLSVLEHLLAFYYNDISYVAMQKKKEKNKRDKETIKSTLLNTDAIKVKNKQGKKKQIMFKRSSLKFPFIALSKEKVNKMFENYFSVFKEKTVETEGLNLENHSNEHTNLMKQFDEKRIIIQNKIHRFIKKNKIILETVLKKKKDFFSKMKKINLPYDSYFYEILSHFKIRLKNPEYQMIANLMLKDDDSYYITLNSSIHSRNSAPYSIKELPQGPFLFRSFWENNDD